MCHHPTGRSLQPAFTNTSEKAFLYHKVQAAGAYWELGMLNMHRQSYGVPYKCTAIQQEDLQPAPTNTAENTSLYAQGLGSGAAGVHVGNKECYTPIASSRVLSLLNVPSPSNKIFAACINQSNGVGMHGKETGLYAAAASSYILSRLDVLPLNRNIICLM